MWGEPVADTVSRRLRSAALSPEDNNDTYYAPVLITFYYRAVSFALSNDGHEMLPRRLVLCGFADDEASTPNPSESVILAESPTPQGHVHRLQELAESEEATIDLTG